MTRDQRARHGHELEAARPVLKTRFWRGLGSNGETYADTRLPEHLGGLAGAARHSRDPRQLHRRQDRRELRHRNARGAREAVPRADRAGAAGRDASWNGKATIDFWTGYRWTKGSYSYWKVGQYTAFSGMEGKRAGQLPLRRRAHLDRLPGIPERRRRNGPARSRGDPRRLQVASRSDRRSRLGPCDPG